MSANSEFGVEGSPADDSIMRGKAPRHLHMLAAACVALLGVGLYGVQSLFGGGPARSAELPAGADKSPPVLTEPRIDRLQSEINRQQEVATPIPAEATAQRGGGRGRTAATDAEKRIASRQEGADSAPRDAQVAVPAIARYESEKQENAIAASKILTLQHQDVAAPETGLKASPPGRAVPSLPASDVPESVPPSRSADILRRLERMASEAGADRVGLARDWLATRRVDADPPAAAALPAHARPPAARHLVVQGSVLPAVLLTQIRSDLPGVLSALVTEDVFDSATVARVLVPRGTRLVGEYDSRVADGQSAVLAAFGRMIFPNGASVQLGAMPAADASGAAGLEGEVNTHFWARFGTQLLTAAIARAVQRPNGTYGVLSSGGLVTTSDAAGQILVETARVPPRSLGAVGPTITVKRGTRFEILVNRDLALDPAITGAQ